MARFADIIGHDQIVLQLRQAVGRGQVGHAYLIQGDTGTGKRLLAQAFAQTLQCEKGMDDACGQCHSCRQAQGSNHPDIIRVQHEKPELIRVDEIRSQLVNDVQIRPYNGKYKVYIVEDAEKMNPQAQNALLKTLEEPPSYAVILLLTTNASMLLDTIQSRCVRLDLRPVRDELVEGYLMEHARIPDYQARLCASFAQGSIGKAMELAVSEDFGKLRDTALLLVMRVKEMDASQISAMVKETAAFRENITDFLGILSAWYRDTLYFKATASADSLIFRDQLQQIRRMASESSYEGIEIILGAIRKARARLDARVNFDLTMELLFLTMKEN